MPLTPGSRLGPYEIVAPIGAGGMGEVFRARDTRLDRTVAIKVLHEHLSAQPEVHARFEREARAVSSLNHAHICVLHDVGHQDGIDFLVMEYVEGENLAARLERGPLHTEELLRVAIQIADALDKAHRQGLVHRDLKPGNVMLSKSGAKLLDFGLARATGLAANLSDLSRSPTMSRPLTAEGTIVGTFQYLPPEVLEGGDADARGDIFAFGATLFEMATGKRAFEGKSQASVIAAILEREPPPISTLQPMAPPALDRLIRQCLAKNPDERRQSMHDVLLELRWISEGGSKAGLPAPVAAKRKSRTRLAWISTGVATASAVAFAIGYFGRAPSKPQTIRFEVPAPIGLTGVGSPKISPDGRLLAFQGRDSTGVARLWIRTLNSLVAQPLPGTEGTRRPFWSPDGRHLAFFAGGKLRKIAAGGGPPQTICESANGADGSWSQAGVILFDAGTRDSISRVSASGGVPGPATFLDRSRGEVGHAWPQFLPDGKHFLYLAFGVRGDSTSLKVGTLDSRETKVLSIGSYSRIEYAAPGYILFARDRALMAQPFDARGLRWKGEPFPIEDEVFAEGTGPGNADFSASAGGILTLRGGVSGGGDHLVWVDRSGKEWGNLGETANYTEAALSPDDQRVVAGIASPNSSADLWVLEPARGTASRLTFDSNWDGWPVWSPDGTHIAYTSDRRGSFALYRKRSDGVGEDELLADPGMDVGPWDWSADGRQIACCVSAGATRWDVWIVPTDGDRKPVPFLQSPFSEISPKFSPDGRWIAYSSNESGRREIFARPFPGPGGKWQVSVQGGTQPLWRRDGKEIFFIAPEGMVMSVDVIAGIAFQVGTPRPLFRTIAPTAPTEGPVYSVTADGQRFLVQKQTRNASIPPTTVVLNWTAGFREK